MVPCGCTGVHQAKRIVLTGGPGAGKTAVLELIRQAFCEHVVVLPEAAGVLFGGGFPRGRDDVQRKAAQRAIYYVQRELEVSATALQPAIILCDRGTIDGAAYWPGPDHLWDEVKASLVDELARYDSVIHLRTPAASLYNRDNPLRVESASEAQAIDERIAVAWSSHPHRFVIDAEPDFLSKAARALEVLRNELPACCRGHKLPTSEGRNSQTSQPSPKSPSADR